MSNARIADMKPFVTALLSRKDVENLAKAAARNHTVRWSRRCPNCPGVWVIIERKHATDEKGAGWQFHHPAPWCPEYARYAEAI